MSISEPFIRRPVGTALLAAGVFIVGRVAYRYMPVAAVPRVDFPMISVSANLPGADPETVASSLAAPLERRLGQIAGVAAITSASSLGGTSVTVQFDLSRKVDACARDVQAAINAAASDLPINLPNPPTYRKVNPADAPIMVLAMMSDTHASTEIFEYADEIIGQRLSQVEGVSQVLISGAEKTAVRVQVNPAALASTGQGLVVRQMNGMSVRLGDLAEISDGVENNRLAGWAGSPRWGGMKRAVLLVIFKQPGANVIQTVERIRAVLPQTEKWLPPSVKIHVLSDRTYTIRASVDDVQISLMISIALVVMVIFLFLRRLWPTVIASMTVPLA